MSHQNSDRLNDFYALSPERILDAVEVDDRSCTGRFIILNSYENRVYQLELDDESPAGGAQPAQPAPSALAPMQTCCARSRSCRRASPSWSSWTTSWPTR